MTSDELADLQTTGHTPRDIAQHVGTRHPDHRDRDLERRLAADMYPDVAEDEGEDH